MITAFKSIYVIFKNEDFISFCKVKNTGFLRYNRGATYILNNKYELAFGNVDGYLEDYGTEEFTDIMNFINKNNDLILNILNASTDIEKRKLIEELD